VLHDLFFRTSVLRGIEPFVHAALAMLKNVLRNGTDHGLRVTKKLAESLIRFDFEGHTRCNF
jgi:hypothetical protein